MARLQLALTAALGMIAIVFLWLAVGPPQAGADPVDATKGDYPAPRFPGNLKNPKSIDDILPYARYLVRNKAAFQSQGFGILNAGDTCIIVDGIEAEDMYVQAIIRALGERKVKVILMHEWDILGVPRQQLADFRKYVPSLVPAPGLTTEQGSLEAASWASFPGGREFLKQRRPDLYARLYPHSQALPPALLELGKKLRAEYTEQYLLKYMADHPDIRGVYYGKGGPIWYGFHPHEDKWLGIFTYDNRYDVMQDMSSYPAELWLLSEEATMEPLAQVDKVHAFDPEGTDLSFEVTAEQAQRWAKGVYLRGHLFMFPQETYGVYAFDAVSFPALKPDYIPVSPTVNANGIVAGTNGHAGFFPRIEEHFVNGYLKEVKGGGLYGDIMREFLEHYPGINTTTFPQMDHPGWFYHYESALGTNPKFTRHSLDTFMGTAGERMRSGVIHWAMGAVFLNDPDSHGGNSKILRAFGQEHKLPGYHGFHIHTYFTTYQAHLRDTNKWLTLIDKGHLTALDNSEARALASRYGNPDKVLAESWIPEVPGINVPGNYERDYAPNPYKYSQMVMGQGAAGTYRHFYPAAGANAAAANEKNKPIAYSKN